MDALFGPKTPLPPERAFIASARRVDDGRVAIEFRFSDDYYMYRNQIHLELRAPVGARIERVELPPAVTKDDATYGRTSVYVKPFVVEAVVSGADARPIAIHAVYQGCFAPRGICYPPQKARFDLPSLPPPRARPGR